MAEEQGIYKCEICGNVVSVLINGAGELVCCNQPMKLQEEHTQDEGNEKHLPVIEKTENGVKVKVGSIPHPMEEKHFIQMVQLIKDGKIVDEKRLHPGQEPVVEFTCEKGDYSAREYCNLHGLWLK